MRYRECEIKIKFYIDLFSQTTAAKHCLVSSFHISSGFSWRSRRNGYWLVDTTNTTYGTHCRRDGRMILDCLSWHQGISWEGIAAESHGFCCPLTYRSSFSPGEQPQRLALRTFERCTTNPVCISNNLPNEEVDYWGNNWDGGCQRIIWYQFTRMTSIWIVGHLYN